MNSPQLFYRLGTRAHKVPLRDCVARDVVNLLNCALRGASLVVSTDTPVASSVLNFGNPCMLPMGRSRVDPFLLATNIRHTLGVFEPRLLVSHTTVVARQDTDSVGSSSLYFDVHGALKPHATSISIRLRLDYLNGLFSWVREGV